MNSCSVTWLAARPPFSFFSPPSLLSRALSWPLSLCCPLPHRLFVLYSVFRTTTKPGAMDQMRLAFNGVVRSQPTFCTLSHLYHCLYHEQTDKTEAIAKWQALFSFFFYFLFFIKNNCSIVTTYGAAESGACRSHSFHSDLLQVRSVRYSRFPLQPTENGERHLEVKLSEDGTEEFTDVEAEGSPSFRPAPQNYSRCSIAFLLLGTLLILIVGRLCSENLLY